jgi:hypothetical protein
VVEEARPPKRGQSSPGNTASFARRRRATRSMNELLREGLETRGLIHEDLEKMAVIKEASLRMPLRG